MAKQHYLERYMLIIKKVRKGLCNLNEIAEYIERETELRDIDFHFSQRTFQRDLNDIRDIFGVDIQYDPSRKGYFIDEEGANISNLRMIEAYDLFNVLRMSEQLSEYIIFEERQPQGTDYFYPLLQAIKSKNIVQIIYQKFWKDHPNNRTLFPYALKEVKGRWYLLAVDEYDNRLKTYALDRIKELEVLKKKFEPNINLHVKDKFKHSFGIISQEDSLPELVELSFTPLQGKYIVTYPLHKSQDVLFENEEEIRIKLNIHLTHDFIMELMSFGDDVKVLTPIHLQDTLKENFRKSLDLYL